MNNGNSANLLVTGLLFSTSNHIRLLERHAKDILQRDYQLSPVQDVNGRWYWPREFLEEMLLSLQKVEDRGLLELKQRNVPVLRQIFDNIELEMAKDLEPHANQVNFIAANFEEWVYRSLFPLLRGTANVYRTLTQTTFDIYQELSLTRGTPFQFATLSNPDRPPFPSNRLCSGAVRLINGYDDGRIALINPSSYYLVQDSRAHVRAHGGSYRWWICHRCAFRCEFYVGSSSRSISESTCILEPTSHSDMRYRSVLSAKFHLPTSDVKVLDRQETETLGCAVCVAEGRSLRRGENMFKKRGQLLDHLHARHSNRLPTELIMNRLGITVGPYAPPATTFDVHFMR